MKIRNEFSELNLQILVEKSIKTDLVTSTGLNAAILAKYFPSS